MAHADHRPSYFLIYVYLVVLALASVLASFVLPGGLATLAIFLLAAAKAILVALFFMHLRVESLYIHSLALVPLLFVLILFLGLVPDIALVYGG